MIITPNVKLDQYQTILRNRQLYGTNNSISGPISLKLIYETIKEYHSTSIREHQSENINQRTNQRINQRTSIKLRESSFHNHNRQNHNVLYTAIVPK